MTLHLSPGGAPPTNLHDLAAVAGIGRTFAHTFHNVNDADFADLLRLIHLGMQRRAEEAVAAEAWASFAAAARAERARIINAGGVRAGGRA
ncbi:hypothetical protein [Teichococcus aerofrigidensis]